MHRSMQQFMCLGVLTLFAFAPALLAADAAPKPFLHPLFSSDMVLQRRIADPIWGWTDPGKAVTVSINGKSATATGITSVSASATQSAKLLIAVRVLDTGGQGGIWGQPTDMRLESPGSGIPPIDISGDWKYKASTELKNSTPGTQGRLG
jgi:hypothetical protein